MPASVKRLFSHRRANSRPRRLWLGDEGKERDDEPPSIERVQKEKKRSRKSPSFFFACWEEEKKGNSSLHDGSRKKKREDVATLPFLPDPIRDVEGETIESDRESVKFSRFSSFIVIDQQYSYGTRATAGCRVELSVRQSGAENWNEKGAECFFQFLRLD